MDPNSKDFLLAEFSSAFEHIQRLDDRRLRFVEFLISFNGALAAVVVAVITRSDSDTAGASAKLDITRGDQYLVCVAAAIAIVATAALMWMVHSERGANLRYRRKVNHIRGIFLHDSDDPGIAQYLADHKSLGTPTNRSDQPTGWGKTLKGVIVLSVIVVVSWLIAAAAVLATETGASKTTDGCAITGCAESL